MASREAASRPFARTVSSSAAPELTGRLAEAEDMNRQTPLGETGAGGTMRADSLGSGSADCISWSGIHFHNFDRRYLKQLGGPGEKFSIREEQPPVTVVEHGAVAAASLQPHERFLGVYDSFGQPVESSIPKRGGKQVPFDRLDAPSLTNARSDGRTAYYIGYTSKQYGHFILETLSRAWAWERHGRDSVPVSQNALPEFGRTFLGYLNGLQEQLELVRSVTRFERVIVASPAFVIGREAYLEFRTLCQQISERAVPDLGPSTDQPAYLSRSGLGEVSRRMLVGEKRLERLFEDEGFLVVRPETLPIAEQIAIFNRHRWIVAPLGSACHTKLFCRRPCNLLVLSKPQLNPNYLLCDQISEGTSHYANVLSSADLGVKLPRGIPEPLMLDDERVLELVKNLGLVRPQARFAGASPDLDSYKRAWISFVRQLARKKSENDQASLMQAAAKVTASLDE